MDSDKPGVPVDVIAHLRELPSTPAILNLAHHGDATTEIMGVTKRARLVKQLNETENGEFDAILFSGGGNDLAGDRFRFWLRDAEQVGEDPTRAVNQQALSNILSLVMAAYEDLLEVRDARNHAIPVLVHSYDFIWPTNIGLCGVGAWLYPALKERGWMNDPNNEGQLDRGRKIAAMVLAEFDNRLRILAADPRSNVIHIETLGTLDYSNWSNELHPTASGFAKISQKFAEKLPNR